MRMIVSMLAFLLTILESGLPLLNSYKDQNANALSTEIMAEKKIVNGLTNSSLNVQLDCKTTTELRNMVPEVVHTIIQGVKRVIGFGATRIVVPSNFPIGCLPIYLTKFMTDNSTAYDEYHCLKDLNNLAIFYNYHLRQAIEELKKEYPNITLIYATITMPICGYYKMP
ncbi:GDSL esterase/lipase At5g03980-like [Nicotiana tomentosiformis]|uniref:GDSL esterase/lipase At5g03980-like n=1 Tax=Nicotiana tomentosiformis TaxID=4098 RepID=UPI00388C85BD